MEDHPRVCGINLPDMTGAEFTLGSPPRMRDKLTKGSVKYDGNRITPAYAG